MGKLLKEFKDFAIKGNVMDMAIGVIIGGAFGKIVSSFVSDIIMPLIGLLVGGTDFTQWKWVLSPANEALGKAEVALTYGNFIQVVFDFLIIAWCIFLVVKAINKAKKPKEEPAPEPPATPEDIQLLREIRDSLKK
ncbi:MAG: large-conductance mechanosensitive channel protein MscL [Bacteroidales bacterium]|nr:large-conductance mechanosensitive channel protein MscL [Bacteroidales bacterium]MBQ6082515.1 large-conductance mechanosensitive channel protein MscL [Bacteroidales bacterium]MBQ9463414.1 large-conductance mechanosensitive channel protein MscL [Bacteroidales bacterium]